MKAKVVRLVNVNSKEMTKLSRPQSACDVAAKKNHCRDLF